jgi:hypothetical protein
MTHVLPDGEPNRERRAESQPTGNRPRKEQQQVVVRHNRADKIDLDLIAEDEAQDQGASGNPALTSA